MFGKRGTGDAPSVAPTDPVAAAPPAARVQAATAPRPTAVAPPQPTARSAAPVSAARPAAAAPARPSAPPAPTPRAPDPSENPEYRSEAYYRVKSTIFNALIETIDLTQLAQLDPESARDEIRDIVAEIISIKNVVMSIAEQEALLDDICNDVLGYGPLEPLLARDDIADVMVNGANAVFIEVNGKISKTGIRFR
ncbi:MAG: CpaF family protein, partial [Terricaulis sp.]